MDFYNKSIEEIFKELKTSEGGLSLSEANNRIDQYGSNILEERKGKSAFRRFIDQFNDMMIIILIIVAIIMGIYGFLYSHEYTDCIVIAVVVLINAIMGFIQEQKAEVTLAGLKKYSNVTCKVKRDNEVRIVDAASLVPGDIILLDAGDCVPADARIITESNLAVDESPLTGESVPVKKNNLVLTGDLQIQDQANMIFSGCNITNGRVEAVVVKTGMMTELGLIAVSLNTPYEVDTPLQYKIKELSKKITFLIFFILIFMFIFGLIKGYKILEIIMLCVSLAVAAIPEGLPAVITIALSTGAGVLAKKKTVVRQMTAVETLGSTDVICSDKTGTITQNKMTVVQTKLYNENIIKYIMALCNDSIVDGKKFVGDPTETCLFEYLIKRGFDPVKIRTDHKRLGEAPFDSNRKMMSTINKINGKTYVLVKGSLENLLNQCTSIYLNGKKTRLSKAMKEQLIKEEADMAADALRVISFAYKEVKTIPSEASAVLKEEKGLIYAGMVGIIDPPRESVYRSVQKCHRAGIKPVMITGDSLVTACAIAKEVGIIESEEEGILGSELDKYDDDEMCEIVQKYSVYARVSPEHKQRIVTAWQRNGKVVAMTGDGVNDAPAIKDAHVGVGMGITGTEVTKSVADVILLDDSFSTIVVAVEEGRRIFNNIRNNIVYSLSSNFAEIAAVLVGMFSGVNILLPIHILFIDLVTDSVPSICLSFEKSEKGIMNREPRGIDKPLFTPFINATIIMSAIVESLFVIGTYFVCLKPLGALGASSMALLSMVMQEIIFAVSCRNLKQYISRQGFFSNSTFNIGLFVLIAIESLVFLTPVGKLISVEFVGINTVLIVAAINLASFAIYELFKPIGRKLFKD